MSVTRTPTRSIPSTATSTPTPSHHSSSNAGAIAGGTVGGVVGLALLLGLVYFFLRRRRNKRNQSAQPSELGGEGKPEAKEKRQGEGGQQSLVELPSPDPSNRYKHSHPPSDLTAVSASTDHDPRYPSGGREPYGLYPQPGASGYHQYHEGPAPAYGAYDHPNPLKINPVESDSGMMRPPIELSTSNSQRRSGQRNANGSKFTEDESHPGPDPTAQS